jgi:hypothetical protein
MFVRLASADCRRMSRRAGIPAYEAALGKVCSASGLVERSGRVGESSQHLVGTRRGRIVQPDEHASAA